MAGQIIQRGERTWLVRVFLGRDASTGKRRYHNHTVHGTKKDAQKYLNGVLRDIDLENFIEPSKMTLDAYLDQWLETVARPRLRPRTLDTYKRLLTLYVRPILGGCRLSQVKPIDIQTLYNGMQERGLSPRTIRHVNAVLSSAFNQAVKWHQLNQNPTQLIDLPRLERREMHALSPKETTRFLKAAQEDRWGLLFSFAVATGMRPGEYLGLQWKDVDLQSGMVHVQRALVRRQGSWQFEDPKTPRSRRTIPLPKSLTRDLARHRKAQAKYRLARGPKYQDFDLVFTGESGQPLDMHNLVRRHFKPVLKAAGLPSTMRLYDLRHTCATLLLSAGENPKVISERLGHASVSLTLDTYSHVLPDMQKGAADKLEGLLFGDPGHA